MQKIDGTESDSQNETESKSGDIDNDPNTDANKLKREQAWQEAWQEAKQDTQETQETHETQVAQAIQTAQTTQPDNNDSDNDKNENENENENRNETMALKQVNEEDNMKELPEPDEMDDEIDNENENMDNEKNDENNIDEIGGDVNDTDNAESVKSDDLDDNNDNNGNNDNNENRENKENEENNNAIEKANAQNEANEENEDQDQDIVEAPNEKEQTNVNDSKSEETVKLERKIEELQNENQQLRNLKLELQSRVTTLEEEVSRAEMKYEEMNSDKSDKIASLDKELSEKVVMTQQLTEQIGILESQNCNENSERIASLEEKNEQLEEKNRQLQKQLKDWERKARNFQFNYRQLEDTKKELEGAARKKMKELKSQIHELKIKYGDTSSMIIPRRRYRGHNKSHSTSITKPRSQRASNNNNNNFNNNNNNNNNINQEFKFNNEMTNCEVKPQLSPTVRTKRNHEQQQQHHENVQGYEKFEFSSSINGGDYHDDGKENENAYMMNILNEQEIELVLKMHGKLNGMRKVLSKYLTNEKNDLHKDWTACRIICRLFEISLYEMKEHENTMNLFLNHGSESTRNKNRMMKTLWDKAIEDTLAENGKLLQLTKLLDNDIQMVVAFLKQNCKVCSHLVSTFKNQNKDFELYPKNRDMDLLFDPQRMKRDERNNSEDKPQLSDNSSNKVLYVVCPTIACGQLLVDSKLPAIVVTKEMGA